MKKLLIGLSAFLLFSPLHVFAAESGLSEIGRASCRERV